MKIRLGYPLRLTLLYLLIGGLWILFTDRLAAFLFPNPNTLLLVNTYKGWFYVIVTAFFLYLELRRESHIRKQEEAALRLSEDKFKYVFEKSVSGKSLTQLSGGMEVNQAFCEMLGYSREELIKRSWQEITHPEDVELSQRMIDLLLSGEKESVRFTKRYLYKNGAVVWVDLGTALRRDQAGQPLYLMTSVNDITDRKAAEEVIRSAGAYNRSLIEASLDPLVTIGADGKITDVNNATEMATGVTRAGLLGDDFSNYFTDSEKANQGYQKVLAEGFVKDYPLTIRHISGKTTDVLYNASIFKNTQGKVQGIFAAARDITERKQFEEKLQKSEARYQIVFEHSGTANTIFDTECRVILQNKQSQKLTMPADALGKTALEVFGPEEGPIVDRRIRGVLASGVAEVFETKFRMPTGERWIRSSYQPLLDDQQGLVGIQVISQDINAQKLAEETLRDYNTRLATEVEARTRELREAQEKLVRQEKLAVLGQLAGGVGHELRNPLAVINNAVYYLKLVQPDADEKIRKYHSMIEHEVHNSEKIITDLLDFARIKSVDRAPLAVPELVQHVLERFPVPVSIKAVLEFPTDLPQALADPRQMEQVLGNLVVNACQAMASASSATLALASSATLVSASSAPLSEGGTLTISASHVKELLAIAVKDTGAGISPENMQKLFEPLFTTKPKGIGLGLAVSRKLAEANGGRIEVHSEPGQGSTFTLYLPVNK